MPRPWARTGVSGSTAKGAADECIIDRGGGFRAANPSDGHACGVRHDRIGGRGAGRAQGRLPLHPVGGARALHRRRRVRCGHPRGGVGGLRRLGRALGADRVLPLDRRARALGAPRRSAGGGDRGGAGAADRVYRGAAGESAHRHAAERHAVGWRGRVRAGRLPRVLAPRLGIAPTNAAQKQQDPSRPKTGWLARMRARRAPEAAPPPHPVTPPAPPAAHEPTDPPS